MKNFYIVSATIIVVGLAILMAKHMYDSPYNRCVKDCVVVGFTKDQAAAACARLHDTN
ncbi:MULTISPECIES: hypothetical protein [Sphingobium]|jgi:hypothetical protein|uniref:hypothetical protein n=1 Tax=Sphingobium TaxID=165695 RepID=UPI001479023E|nr:MULTISPECIES: hypothetical protein [Sphingobium]